MRLGIQGHSAFVAVKIVCFFNGINDSFIVLINIEPVKHIHPIIGLVQGQNFSLNGHVRSCLIIVDHDFAKLDSNRIRALAVLVVAVNPIFYDPVISFVGAIDVSYVAVVFVMGFIIRNRDFRDIVFVFFVAGIGSEIIKTPRPVTIFIHRASVNRGIAALLHKIDGDGVGVISFLLAVLVIVLPSFFAGNCNRIRCIIVHNLI